MLNNVITKYDSRVTGEFSQAEVSPDTITEIMTSLKETVIDSTSSIFIGSEAKSLYAEHAFYRYEPIENISGFAVALVEDVIEKRNLKWL